MNEPDELDPGGPRRPQSSERDYGLNRVRPNERFWPLPRVSLYGHALTWTVSTRFNVFGYQAASCAGRVILVGGLTTECDSPRVKLSVPRSSAGLQMMAVDRRDAGLRVVRAGNPAPSFRPVSAPTIGQIGAGGLVLAVFDRLAGRAPESA
jgi:hypothetical protein